ncbi:helix-turn-helix domain-containing protein [Streptomyces sp. NBC_01005]|uniref:PucR family transcriptional regulator n=1 Tax=unclassified Streptomyces TaxID=2593676 RepID=UPI003870B84F|nr:helix-turn-helix domain-containing protein [Streptomyces sp. NBC_01005]WTC99873.1 helix-turn-helix domain-containing protein [Streptomyces sp. NBC_01650]
MSGKPHTSLARVLEDLGDVLLEPIAGGGSTRRQLSGVVIHDPLDEAQFPAQAVVLGVGVHEPDDVVRLLYDLGRKRAAALVVRSPFTATVEIRRAADESGVALLGLARKASWAQVAAMLRTLLVERDIGDISPQTLGGMLSGDLFALANAVAALLDAPVTIEDRSSRVLAFSGRQDEADQSRVETILGRRVPERFTLGLARNGVFERLHRGHAPVYVDPLHDETMTVPRVALAVRAGDEILGSIWAAVTGPLSQERMQALIDAGKVVALHMLRLRAGADVERRLRADLVSTTLEGGAGAPEAIARLGLVGQPAIVLALGLFGGSDADPATENGPRRVADRQRVADALAMHLSAVQTRSAVALVGDVAYGIVPMPGSRADCLERSIRVASTFLERTGQRVDAAIGIGPLALDGSGLSSSRDGADRALRVLLANGGARRVATAEDVHVDALMLDLADLAAARGDVATGPVARLLDYDARHQSQLVHTLSCWLDAFGDVGAASAMAYVHPNTFRYRLRRVAEVGEINLDDPGERFAAMLQLRLHPPGTMRRSTATSQHSSAPLEHHLKIRGTPRIGCAT